MSFERGLGEIANQIRLCREQDRLQFDWERSSAGLATKQDLEEMEKRIMSALTDYVASVTAHLDRQDTAIEGVGSDVAFLKRKLEEIQNSPGAITPEDQAALDAALARVGVVTTKLEALNSETPPEPPTA